MSDDPENQPQTEPDPDQPDIEDDPSHDPDDENLKNLKGG